MLTLFLRLVSRTKAFVGGHVWMCLENLYKKYIWPGQNFEQGVKLCKDSQHIIIRCFRKRESICSVIDLENVIKKKRTKSLGVSWLCGSSQKLVFLLIASLQKVIQWTTNEVTQALNYETVAKVEAKMNKVLKQKEEI